MTSPTTTPISPARLWKHMTAEQRLAAAKAFWLDEQGANEQMQAVFLIAQQKKFRPKSVVSLDEDRKARHLASLATVPDVVAGRALIAYHLADQRPMMGAFLDALEIKHENGVIEEEEVTPDPAKIPPAVQAIAGQFPREDVSLYLNTLFCQDPDTWKALADAPERGE